MAKTKSSVSFKTWATTIARARTGAAADEVLSLRKKFPEYAKDTMYAKKFPNAFKRYEGFKARGSQSKAA